MSILSQEPVRSPGPAGVTVSLRGVAVGYGGPPVLLVDELHVHGGQVSALIGPNGAGKSTLLAAVAGLRRPTAGTISVLGVDPRQARSQVAVVLQSTAVSQHLPATVADVVAMGRYPARGVFGRFGADDRAAIDRALERLAVADLRRRPIQQLSGGQRQRVFVAQALAQEADVLLLDEPVSGLDVVSQELIQTVIADEAAAGRTVVVSTHDLAEAGAADQLVLVAGRIVAAGPPASVLTDDNLAAAYGRRLVRLPGGGLVVDDGSHHDHGGHGHGHGH